jgi:hypothetical protein
VLGEVPVLGALFRSTTSRTTAPNWCSSSRRTWSSRCRPTTSCRPTSTPQWDRHFGESARIALARQIIEPEAGRNPDPVAGMDGHAARTAYERYQKASSEAAAQPSSFTIGVSGAK